MCVCTLTVTVQLYYFDKLINQNTVSCPKRFLHFCGSSNKILEICIFIILKTCWNVTFNVWRSRTHLHTLESQRSHRCLEMRSRTAWNSSSEEKRSTQKLLQTFCWESQRREQAAPPAGQTPRSHQSQTSPVIHKRVETCWCCICFPEWLPMLANLSLTWYLLIRHHTRDRNFSNLGSSIQLYRYRSSCLCQRNKCNKIKIQCSVSFRL